VDLKTKCADQEIDLLAEKAFQTVAIQVRRYDPERTKVGSPAVRATIGSAQAAGVEAAHVVTSLLFTGPAEDAARGVTGTEIEFINDVEFVSRRSDESLQCTLVVSSTRPKGAYGLGRIRTASVNSIDLSRRFQSISGMRRPLQHVEIDTESRSNGQCPR